jgi:hypothetical protein
MKKLQTWSAAQLAPGGSWRLKMLELAVRIWSASFAILPEVHAKIFRRAMSMCCIRKPFGGAFSLGKRQSLPLGKMKRLQVLELRSSRICKFFLGSFAQVLQTIILC